MNNLTRTSLATVLALLLGVSTTLAAGRTQLRSICRLKGQEENYLQGMGLVVGLNGTGEANDPQTMRALARAMELLGSPVSQTGRMDAQSLAELKKIKNASLVIVTATVPATGSRRGDKLDCFVSAVNGKSLAGGRLAFASLVGPNTRDQTVYAVCQGQIVVDDPSQPMVGRIHGGAQMQEDVFTKFFSEDGFITLVLDENHADFPIADAIAQRLQQSYDDQYAAPAAGPAAPASTTRALDARNIRVRIPEQYRNDPVAFAAEVLESEIYDAEPEARVVVNPRSGGIVISGDVEIGDVVVTHRNLVIEAGPAAVFAPVDPGDANEAKLERLVSALANLKVPADDIIEIIRLIERNGKLHGKLIIE